MSWKLWAFILVGGLVGYLLHRIIRLFDVPVVVALVEKDEEEDSDHGSFEYYFDGMAVPDEYADDDTDIPEREPTPLVFDDNMDEERRAAKARLAMEDHPQTPKIAPADEDFGADEPQVRTWQANAAAPFYAHPAIRWTQEDIDALYDQKVLGPPETSEFAKIPNHVNMTTEEFIQAMIDEQEAGRNHPEYGPQ